MLCCVMMRLIDLTHVGVNISPPSLFFLKVVLIFYPDFCCSQAKMEFHIYV